MNRRTFFTSLLGVLCCWRGKAVVAQLSPRGVSQIYVDRVHPERSWVEYVDGSRVATTTELPMQWLGAVGLPTTGFSLASFRVYKPEAFEAAVLAL
jgi:hypothetical protein